jgi:hypothetical protein
MAGGWCRVTTVMRRFRLILVFSCALAASAGASNERHIKPAEYHDATEAERADARAKSRNKVSSWKEAEPLPESRFPWMQVAFVAILLGGAAPFGWWFYRRASKEQVAATAFAKKRRSSSDEPS